MVPAQQRLEAEDRARSEVGERLVVDLELASADRQAQVGFELAALAQRLVHRRLVEAGEAAALRLGAVERHVGILDEVARRVGVGGEDGDADAGADPRPSGRRSRRARPSALDDPLGEQAGMASGWLPPCLDHRELVAAEPGDQLVAAHHRAQPCATSISSSSPAGMAVNVVDRLEAVEVDAQHRDRLAARRPCRRRGRDGRRTPARLGRPVSAS